MPHSDNKTICYYTMLFPNNITKFTPMTPAQFAQRNRNKQFANFLHTGGLGYDLKNAIVIYFTDVLRNNCTDSTDWTAIQTLTMIQLAEYKQLAYDRIKRYHTRYTCNLFTLPNNACEIHLLQNNIVDNDSIYFPDMAILPTIHNKSKSLHIFIQDNGLPAYNFEVEYDFYNTLAK